MICITCGKNEAVNDFYKECQECIEAFQIQKAIKIDEWNRDQKAMGEFK